MEISANNAILIQAFLQFDVPVIQAVPDDEQTQIYFLTGWVPYLAPSSPEKIIHYDCPFADDKDSNAPSFAFHATFV